jgi:hypothetical protein
MVAWYRVRVQRTSPDTEILYEININGNDPLQTCASVVSLLGMDPSELVERNRDTDEGWILYSIHEYDVLIAAVEDPEDKGLLISMALTAYQKGGSKEDMLKALLGGVPVDDGILPLTETIEYNEFKRNQ